MGCSRRRRRGRKGLTGGPFGLARCCWAASARCLIPSIILCCMRNWTVAPLVHLGTNPIAIYVLFMAALAVLRNWGDAPRRYACTFGDTPGLRRVRPEPSIWPRREYWRPTRRCLRLASRGTGGPVRDVLDRHRFLRFGQALGLSLGGRYAAAAPFGTRAKGRPVTCSNCCEAARRRSSAPSATFAAPGRAETAGRRCPAS